MAPEERSIAVFKRGISKGLKAWIPTGGQVAPNSIAGPKELWKKPQKKLKKKATSEMMNQIIPIRKLRCTAKV